MQKVVAVIVAGGSGTRMGGDVRKQYLELGGIPLMGHALKAFDGALCIDSLILVVPESDMAVVSDTILPQCFVSKPLCLVKGGLTRQASVANGLARVPEGASHVVVHDAVRPFVEPAQICAVVDAAVETGAATLTLDVVDTLREVTPDGMTRPVNRDRIVAIQTPQAFSLPVLQKAHENALHLQVTGTDDAGLVSLLKQPVAFVPGKRTNLKVTTPEDLLLAEALISVTG